MRVEIETLKSVEWQLKQWESDYNSELAVSQRIADKTEKQKEEMAKEKQKQVNVPGLWRFKTDMFCPEESLYNSYYDISGHSSSKIKASSFGLGKQTRAAESSEGSKTAATRELAKNHRRRNC